MLNLNISCPWPVCLTQKFSEAATFRIAISFLFICHVLLVLKHTFNCIFDLEETEAIAKLLCVCVILKVYACVQVDLSQKGERWICEPILNLSLNWRFFIVFEEFKEGNLVLGKELRKISNDEI